MEEFEVVFYWKANGTKPMVKFLDSLEPKLRAKVDRDIAALRDQADMLWEPYSKSMGKGLFELRVHRSRLLFLFLRKQNRGDERVCEEVAESPSEGDRTGARLQGRLGEEVRKWMILIVTMRSR